MNYVITRNDEYLEHFGIKGQKHGIRRYQNEDGSLTPEGKERYGEQRGWEARQMYKRGTITKEQKKAAMKSDGAIGKIDNAMNLGLGRRMREFNQRHEKGMRAASMALAGISAASSAHVMNSMNYDRGNAVVRSLLAGGLAAASAGAGHWVGSRINDAILDRSYNKNSNKAGKKG